MQYTSPHAAHGPGLRPSGQGPAGQPVIALHYTAAPIIGGVEGILTEHVRLLAAHGHPTGIIAGRGAPDVLLPEIDSRHPQVLAVQAELDAGRVPPAFDTLRAQIRAT